MKFVLNQATLQLLILFAAAPLMVKAKCCSQKFKTCDGWCGSSEEDCDSCGNGQLVWIDLPSDSCIERWGMGCQKNSECCYPGYCAATGQCMYDPKRSPQPSPTSPPVTLPSPAPPTIPTRMPTLQTPTLKPTALPTRAYSEPQMFSTENTISTFEALLKLDDITFYVQENPPIYSIVAEGGAAGTDVVSEGQGYALLVSGIALASMDHNDSNRNNAIDIFYGYFNGWKKMAELSSSGPSSCQTAKFCAGGTVACLPGWKYPKELDSVIGTGSAPDGDVDAIAGMIFGVQAVANDATKPVWLDEVRMWADASATQFMYSETVPSFSGKHRIVKLGSCWGGWNEDGNNPSYHSPGGYRMMRDYQHDFSGRDYTIPDFGDGLSIKERWNKLIATSYEYLEVTQCADIGTVPNWATVSENSANGHLIPQTYPFSGSGTPQYEFGAEAGRTMWRVAFDAVLYPSESGQANSFLAPIHGRLESYFDPDLASGSPWPKETLASCRAFDEQPQDTIPMNGWIWIQFMYSPVYSTLVVPSSSITEAKQQEMVDAVGLRINDGLEDGPSYYHRCWSIIGILTLNGDIEKASRVLNRPSRVPVSAAPTKAPIASPTTPEGCYSNNYKDCIPDGFADSAESCSKIWLSTGSQSNCVALWGDCTVNDCCEPAKCFGDNQHAVCVPPSGNS